jgi:hypothetical protein
MDELIGQMIGGQSGVVSAEQSTRLLWVVAILVGHSTA